MAIGITLVVGVLGGVAIERVTASPAAAEVSGSASTQTVEVTVQADPVTATVTVEPQPTDSPDGPKANGNYLVGPELAPGTWQCSKGGDLIYWAERNASGDLTDNGLSTLATIDEGTYIADLTGCAGMWSLVTR